MREWRVRAIIGRMGVGIRAWRERVARAVDDGASLDEVETSLIAPAPLPPELRDALWLYAWGLSERHDGLNPAVQRLARS